MAISPRSVRCATNGTPVASGFYSRHTLPLELHRCQVKIGAPARCVQEETPGRPLQEAAAGQCNILTLCQHNPPGQRGDGRVRGA